MTSIPSLSGISGVQATPQNSNAKLQAAIARLVGLPGLFPTADSVAGLSTVAKLQAQIADIRQLSGNIAGSLSLSQVAESGVSDIEQAVQQLQSLAQQVQSAPLTAEARAGLNAQFQQVARQIDTIATGTRFNSQPLLDGSLNGGSALSLETAISGNNVEGGAGDLSIGDLRTSALFGGQTLDLSADAIAGTVEALGNALVTLGNVRSSISVFQQALDFASANVDTALANQLAAQSDLADADIGSQLADNVQQNAHAVTAQTSQLSPALLRLIS